MITVREMQQLFFAISSMNTLRINDFWYIDKVATLKLLATFCETVPEIEAEGDGEKTVWHLKWPIPLTDVVKDNDGEKEPAA